MTKLFICLFYFSGLPLAKSKCSSVGGGRHGPPAESHRGRHYGEPSKEIHGRLHLRILFNFRKYPAEMVSTKFLIFRLGDRFNFIRSQLYSLLIKKELILKTYFLRLLQK